MNPLEEIRRMIDNMADTHLIEKRMTELFVTREHHDQHISNLLRYNNEQVEARRTVAREFTAFQNALLTPGASDIARQAFKEAGGDPSFLSQDRVMRMLREVRSYAAGAKPVGEIA